MQAQKKEKLDLKNEVRDFWNAQSCGEVYAVGQSEKELYQRQMDTRYRLEPYIFEFAKFQSALEKDVLEIGVGMGADHLQWAKNTPKSLHGIDLTPRAILHTKKMLALYGLESNLKEADAEFLPFENASFDIVYSWGVLHHSPNTPKAIREAFRVLRKGGVARIMIYHRYSLTGYMLWLKYALLKGQFCTLDKIYSEHLESPGTKAYTVREAQKMCADFSKVNVRVQLNFGDLLEGAVGQRHRGLLLSLAKRIWPRKFIKWLLPNHGLMLLIEAVK